MAVRLPSPADSYQTSGEVLQDFLRACEFIGFKSEWFSVQAHSLDRFLRPRLHELKKNNAELLGGVLLRDVFYVLAGLKSGGRVVFN